MQFIKGGKKNLGSIGNLMLTKSDPEEGYQAMDPDNLNIAPIEFNPGITTDIELENGDITTVNIYDRIFIPFEEEYKKITDLDIDLSEGSIYGKSINRETDQNSNHDLEMYKKEAMMIANEDIRFRNLPEGIKNRFSDNWGTRIYGMVDYLQNFVPEKETKEGKQMQAAYDNILEDAYHDFIVPMITAEARSTGKEQSVDSPGDWYNQMVGRKDIAFGTAKQASRDLLATIEQMSDPQLSRHGTSIANPDISKTVEDYADDIMKEGVLQELRGEKRLEEADPPTGKYTLTWDEKDLKAMEAFQRGTVAGKIESLTRGIGTALSNPKYAAYKMTENLGSQAVTTVLGTGLGATAQLIPQVRALTTVARMGVGLLATLPASAIGYTLESGDAFSESRDFMRKLRIRAKAEKGKISDEQFDQLYGIWLNKDYKITADQLKDEDITDIATELGQAYAKLATGIELVANNLQAGAAARQVAKAFGAKMAKGKGAKSLQGIFASKWFSTIKKGGGAAAAFSPKGFLVEATEEGIQAWMQQTLLSDRLPQKRKDMGQVFNEAMAGGLFGQSMRATIGIGSKSLAALTKDKDIKSSVLEKEKTQELEQREIDSKDSVDDQLILTGSLFDPSYERLADAIYPEDQVAKDRIITRMPQKIEELNQLIENPAEAAILIALNKKTLEQAGIEINEETLDKAAPEFTDTQISQILQIPEKELRAKGRKSKTNVMPGVKTKKEVKLASANLPYPDEDFTQEPTFDDQEPIEVAEYQAHEKDMLERTIDEIDMTRNYLLDTPLSDQNITNAERQEKLSNLDKREAKLQETLNKLEATSIPDASKKKTIEKKKPKPVKAKPKIKKDISSQDLTAKAKKAGLKVFQRSDDEWTVRKESGVVKVDKEGLIELIGDGKSSAAVAKVPLNKATKNVAANIKKKVNKLIPFNTLAPELLEKLPEDKLIDYAKKLGVPTEGRSRNQIIADSIENAPPIDLQGGMFGFKIGFKSKELRQINKFFLKGWADIVKNSDIIDSSSENFQKFVVTAGPMMPNHLKEAFYDWANDYNPSTIDVSQFVDPFLKAFQGNEKIAAELKVTQNDIDEVFMNSSETMTEGLHKKYSEGADIKIDNYTHINSAYFHGMGITLLKDQIKAIEDQVRLVDSFEEWVKVISQEEFGLINEEGLTPIDVIANDLEQGRLLNQYFVSNLPENNLKINRGGWIVDNETGQYESSQNKRVNLKLQKDKIGFKPNTLQAKKQVEQEATVGIDDITIRKGPNLPTIDRPTMYDRFGNYPLYWLNGTDIRSFQYNKDITGKLILNENNRPTGRLKKIYGFLDGDDMARLSRDVLAPKNKIALFIRGDTDKLGVIDITNEHFELAKDYELYWEMEQALYKIDKNTVDNYKGEGLTDEELAKQYQSPSKYRAANIARHEAFKTIFGTDYHLMGDAHTIMHRNKILFTPALTRTGGRESSLRLIDLSTSKDAVSKGKASPLTTKTYYPGGKSVEKELVVKMAVGNEYVGDGQLITSQRVFDQKYSEEVGARKGVKRAKTVKVIRRKNPETLEDNGLLLMKLQEMTYGLPSKAEKAEIFNGTEKIAEIRRDKDGENIYTADKQGNFNVYTDHLGTTDESKVSLGEFRNFDSLIMLPSEATGHIQMTESDKSKAPFPMQSANYITDEGYIDNLNKLINDPGGAYGTPEYNPNAPVKVLNRMYQIASNPDKADKFVLDMRSRHPDSVPRTIVEAARLKAGLHATQTSYLSVLAKNKLLIEAMDVKQKGAVLDFRANFTDTVEKGNIVLPFEHSIKNVIAESLSSLQSLDKTSIMGKSMSQLNQLIKDNPISVMLVRHPIGSRGGYRIYNIDKFESGIGDSFLINDIELKDVFEADHDHDTGHVSVLPTYMLTKMRENQATLEGFDFSKYTKDVKRPNIGSLSETIRLMGDMSAGQTAIGEIANVQRVAGISQYIFNEMKIDGKVVKVRKLTSKMTNPETGEKTTLEEYYKLWGQAAFDNVSHRLLTHWDYSQQKLYEQLFYNSNGEPLSDLQYEILNHGYIKTLKYTQAIKKGESFGNSLSLTEVLKLSESYDTFVNNRERMIRQRLRDLDIEGGWDGMANDLVEDINLSSKSHPHETLATLPYRTMPADLTIDDLFNPSDLHSKAAHDIAYTSISDRQKRLEMALKGYQKDVGDPNLTFDKLTDEDYAEILQEIEKGEEWGSQMRTVMNSVYANFENDIEGESIQREANSQTWDYNSDFTQFADDWINGTEGNVGYKELSEVAKIASTYQFLNGVWDPKNGHMQYNARKIPPQMADRGIFVSETLMHPEVMLPFNVKYNEIINDKNFSYEDYKINPQERFHKTVKRYFGCE